MRIAPCLHIQHNQEERRDFEHWKRKQMHDLHHWIEHHRAFFPVSFSFSHIHTHDALFGSFSPHPTLSLQLCIGVCVRVCVCACVRVCIDVPVHLFVCLCFPSPCLSLSLSVSLCDTEALYDQSLQHARFVNEQRRQAVRCY